jgi:hypothetical protein
MIILHNYNNLNDHYSYDHLYGIIEDVVTKLIA